LNEHKLQAFLDKMGSDIGTTMTGALVYIGQKLGLYKAMAGAGPLTSAELAQKTGTAERYIREWLVNQAATGYVEYDPVAQKFSLPLEHALALADEDGQYYVGGFYSAKAVLQATDKIADAFRTGEGLLWSDQDPDLFVGTEFTFRPIYQAFLINSWLPVLEIEVQKKLRAGGRIADIGCGRGASTLLLGKAFPSSYVFGFDNHNDSVQYAETVARKEGFYPRVQFQVAASNQFPNGPYDLITFFTCLHDMADPVAAMKRSCETLDKNGSVMIVETMAGEKVEDNFNMIGVIFSAVSTLCCVPNAIAGGGSAMGAIASGKEIQETAFAGGFKSCRQIAVGPINRVFEVRK
jgi:2-polyprenyl-3-methyl-5-hydroxy-6-metoxy-1,4-benzoquinol methylase